MATIDMGGKEGEGLLCPFLERGSWVPILHNVAWAEAYLHAKCHPAVWPQYTNVTDRQDRQDRTTVRYHRATVSPKNGIKFFNV